LAYEKLRFARIAREHLARTDAGGDGIGTLNEKRLHAVLKDYMCEEHARQEVRLDDHLITGKYPLREDKIIRRDADRYVADVLTEAGEIIEIQTGGFYPLAKKIDFYLRMTDCRITVVHPLLTQKWVRRLTPETGEITAPRRSPKHERVIDLARELYWVAPYLAEPRFSLQLELLEVEEIRVNTTVRRGRQRTERVECVPISLLDEVVLACPEDYAAYFLPDEGALPSPISAAAYAAATGIRGRAVYGMLGILCDLGFLRVIDPPLPATRGRRWERC
jgi:hypothetical protein